MDSTSFVDKLASVVLNAWDKLPQLLLTFLVGFLAVKLFSALLSGFIRVSRAKQALKDILMSVINVSLWLLLIAALLQQMGLTQLAFALSGFVAVAGLAITAGTSSMVQDLISGLFLAQDPDFNVGDRLKINEVEGIIEKMDARKIRLRDSDKRLHVIPNSTLDKSAWVVLDKK